MWLMRTSVGERRAILAAFAGYGLDGFDFMVYTFVIPTLIALWGLSKAEAGYIASATLLTSALGGWGAGILADRFGRVRILKITVLWFAAFTFLSGFTQSYGQMLFTRALQGFGFGGEWAVGSVLVSEIVEARHRGKAAGLVQSSWSFGWGAAALGFWAVSVLCPPDIGWRLLFWVGVSPALLVVYIRRRVQEPAIYLELQSRRLSAAGVTGAPGVTGTARGTGALGASGPGDFLDIFRAPLIASTLLATLLSTGMMGAYYSVTTWLPTYLETERHLSIGDRTGYLLTMIVGSFVGYLTSAWLSDALGRRRCFMLFAGCAALLVLAYTRMPVSGGMLLLGFPLGFFVFGIFSGMGACFAELFPSAVRCSGQGFCYSGGRAIGAACPALIGAWSTRVSLGESIALFTVGAYAIVMLAAWALPETRGRVLGAGTGAAARG